MVRLSKWGVRLNQEPSTRENKNKEEWSDEDDKKLKELTWRNFPTRAIATILGRTENAVRKRITILKNPEKYGTKSHDRPV